MIAAAYLLLNLATILLLQRWRYGPLEVAAATPLPLSATAWTWLPPTIAILAVVGILAAGRRATAAGAGRAWREVLIFHGAVFALVWGLLPTRGVDVASGIAIAICLGGLVFLLRGDPPPAPWRDFGAALRRLLPPTVAMVVALGLAAVLLHARIDGRALGVSLLLYPFYAAIQLLVFVAVPLPRLLKLCGPRTAVIVCAIGFAFVHWPNPLLMGACLLGMLVWAGLWLRRSNLFATALAMGLTASLLAQAVPESATEHMRVGPGAVRERAIAELVGAPEDAPVPAEFLRRSYPLVVGRLVDETELECWQRSIAAAQRLRVAWMFFASDEYGRKYGPGPEGETWGWHLLDEAWRQRIEPFGSADYLAAHGDTFEGFLLGCYEDILCRRPGADEAGGWSEALLDTQRRRLAIILLELRGKLRDHAFDGMSPAALDLP